MSPLVSLILDVDPPTLTHQDRELGWRKKKGGEGLRPIIADSKALAAARKTYETLLRVHPRRPKSPIVGDVALRLVFCWPGCPGKVELYPQKPDIDNAAKTLIDAMAAAEYLTDDKMVVHAELWKLRGPRGFVSIEVGGVAIESIDDVLDKVFPPAKEP
jgi:Holliday junction resolvase RusA-like endonuclease